MEPDPLEVFTPLRGRLFGVAYRIIGSAAEAEDVVQETWLRWQLCDRAAVREPIAFLMTAATRISINVLQSARVRRETYIGPWLPSPVDTSSDPTLGAERSEALHLATLMLMERLTPAERAAYVLREAFDYPYARIAEIVDTTEVASRQLVSRARKHLTSTTKREASREHHQRFFSAFLDAARRGDASRLEALLASDAVNHTDGGGVVEHTARRSILGRDKLVRFFCGFAERFRFWDDLEVRKIEANGRESALLIRDGRAYALVSVEVGEDSIDQILWVMNPAKLSEIAERHHVAIG
ncbi:RNA polymerase sigma-70 factor [Microbacterium sp. SLBN-146]|uniref:RNA polymerase sigma-70 factor n=1 Tax=Microbacterium sp. SLBN-146 TaxID=2768457 RepID=UPI0011521A8E|nr:RNA polymerase sigma-70 factor [Microbacterium sp. SLBN-146]TQJ30314.1 RNA polymerase sigma-70 factor (ECF subfamily) [Microbacterium sp. SLBN-146]